MGTVNTSESIVRDQQAAGYLRHAKLPTQIARATQFLSTKSAGPLPILELGCGPGPMTRLMVERGFKVIAVDFSAESLRLNAESCRGCGPEPEFIHADVREMDFTQRRVGGLMMADLLQHLGDLGIQRAFVERIFSVLAPGGWFYISVFNLNVKNRIRGDVVGSFANGAIHYRRSTRREALSLLPDSAIVERVYPMSIFHTPRLDRFAASLPFAQLLARMTAIYGKRA